MPELAGLCAVVGSMYRSKVPEPRQGLIGEIFQLPHWKTNAFGPLQLPLHLRHKRA